MYLDRNENEKRPLARAMNRLKEELQGLFQWLFQLLLRIEWRSPIYFVQRLLSEIGINQHIDNDQATYPERKQMEIPTCPSEKAAWSRMRASLKPPRINTAPSVPPMKNGAQREAILRALVIGCLGTAGAPSHLVMLPPLKGEKPSDLTTLAGKKCLWVIQTDLLQLCHLDLVKLLMFANAPGAALIIVTDNFEDITYVAQSCGFLPIIVRPICAKSGKAEILLLARKNPGRFIRGKGKCKIMRRNSAEDNCEASVPDTPRLRRSPSFCDSWS